MAGSTLTVSRSKKRFSLLLLEEDEALFHSHRALINKSYLDCVIAGSETASASPVEESNQFVSGNLHVCAFGIIFEPLGNVYPVIRLNYRKMSRLQAWQPTTEQLSEFEFEFYGDVAVEKEVKKKVTWGAWIKSGVARGLLGGAADTRGPDDEKRGVECIECFVSKLVDIGANGDYRPYLKKKMGIPCVLVLEELPGRRHVVLTRMNQLLLFTQMRSHRRMQGQDDEVRDRIEALLTECEAEAMRAIKQMCSLDKGEKLILDCKASKIKPLMATPGRLAITNTHIRFWKFHDYFPNKCQSFPLSSIFQARRRRYMLRHTAVEFTLKSQKSFLFDFAPNTIDAVWHQLRIRETIITDDGKQWRTILKQWQAGQVSNFHYLFFLNAMADRSLHDITQYPVYPWVISDYHSENLDLLSPATYRDLAVPMGALNKDRLKMYKERMKGMSADEPSFLYGSHYSTPGYTLFYLVRSAPEYTLKLQSGKFDQPDRVFHSLETTFRTCCQNPADVKELIPEFFQPPGTFLTNIHNLNLGLRSDGQHAGDVVLPPWARNAADFTTKSRAALESDFVSDNIHKWVDLIFGCNQRGDAAIATDNLFHPFTYEGNVDIESISDPQQRRAVQAQISEFGQTPRQLFLHPHPPRRLSRIPRTPFGTDVAGPVIHPGSPALTSPTHQRPTQQQPSSAARKKTREIMEALTNASEVKTSRSSAIENRLAAQVRRKDGDAEWAAALTQTNLQTDVGAHRSQERSPEK